MKLVLMVILVTIGLVAGKDFWSRNDACEGSKQYCNTHVDCSPEMVCYTDFKCRDPCECSIQCGIGAKCRITNRRPHCYCPPGSSGDAKKECSMARGRFDLERYPRYP